MLQTERERNSLLAKRVSETEQAAEQATKRFEEMATKLGEIAGLASQLGKRKATVLIVYDPLLADCHGREGLMSWLPTPQTIFRKSWSISLFRKHRNGFRTFTSLLMSCNRAQRRSGMPS